MNDAHSSGPRERARVWAGLGRSPFLADVDGRTRQGGRLLAAVAGGTLVGLTAAAAGEIFLGAACTLASGRGGEGAAGLERTLRAAMPGPLGLPADLAGRGIALAADGLFAVGFVAFAAFLARRPIRAYLTAAPAPRARLFGLGLALSIAALAPLALADRILASGGATPARAIAAGASDALALCAGLLLLVPAAVAEELLFRGWLLRQVAAFTRRPAILIALTALLFSAAHLDLTAEGVLNRALLGTAFAYMTLRTGGIELASGAHVANNIVALLIVPSTILVRSDAPDELSAAALIFDLAIVGVFLALTEGFARSSRLRRWAGVENREMSPA